MREAAVLFGPDKSLVGVVSEPDAGAPRTDLAVVFLNAGFTQHVGPQRQYVLLARRLAEAGIVALRFDYSGIGDSPGRQDSMAFEDSTIQEAREAMSFLAATRGAKRFALMGVCWGADNALRVAMADDRVAGAAAVDFYALFSLRYLARTHKNRLVDPRSWWNLIRGSSPVIGRVLGGLLEMARHRMSRDGESSGDIMPVKSPKAIVSDLRAAAERGVNLCFVYAQGAPSYDQYIKHFRRPMRDLESAGQITVHVFDQADHVFTLLRNRDGLMDAVVAWASALAEGSAAAPSRPISVAT